MVECFVVEAKELLQGAEAAMLALEDDPGHQPSVDTVFRAFHTVKGVTAMLGLTVIAEFAHHAENLLSRVRDKEIRFEGGYSSLALRSLDALNALVDGVGRTAAGGAAFPPDDMPELLRAFTDPEAAGYGSEERPASSRPPETVETEAASTAPVRSEAAPTTAPTPSAPTSASASTSTSASLAAPTSAPTTPQLSASPTPSVGVAADPSSDRKDSGRSAHDGDHDGAGSNAAGGGADNSVRVRMDRLDRLVDMVGELVIAQSMVAQDEIMRASGRHDMLK